MTTHHRDMDRAELMKLGIDTVAASNHTPLLFHGVCNGNVGDSGGPSTGLRGTNTACLFSDLRVFEGRHVASYRLSWITDSSNGDAPCGELPLGDYVSHELAVAMYQKLLEMITNAHPVDGEIMETLLKLTLSGDSNSDSEPLKHGSGNECGWPRS